MNLRSLAMVIFATSLFSTAGLTGCAADAADDRAAANTDDLTADGQRLVGSYQGVDGSFIGLVLTSERTAEGAKFFADIDTGIRCIQAPCPSTERVEGTYTADADTITFASTTLGLGRDALGKYSYQLDGEELSIWKTDRQRLVKSRPYCAEASDCSRQGLPELDCRGAWSCGSDNACLYECVNPGRPSGDACHVDADCASGTCLRGIAEYSCL